MVSVLLNVLLPIAVVVIGYSLRRAFTIDQGSLNRVMIYAKDSEGNMFGMMQRDPEAM